MTARLTGRLIVSCQPVVGGPLDRTDLVVALAQAVVAGGAEALRIEGVERVQAVIRAVAVPVIGLVKRDLEATAVRITPWLEDARELAAAGATIVAFDATNRSRPAPVPQLIAAVHAAGALAMADVATFAEGEAAFAAGADLVATTLSGHLDGLEPETPDLDLIKALAAAGIPTVAEGNIRTPPQAAVARRAGALAVVVGSAITRPEHITRWFADAWREG